MKNGTQHANIRAQQRGIAPFLVDLLLEFGARKNDGNGAEICYFDRRAKKRLQSYVGGMLGRLSEFLDAYLVVCGDQVVTAGIRTKHINHI